MTDPAALLFPLGAVLLGMSVVMIAAWLTQRAANNAGWIDVFWTFGTGLSCVLVALWPVEGALPARQMLVAALGAIWALRLGLYIASRVAGSKHEDTRYARFRQEWGAQFQRKLFNLVMVQAPATTILTLSVFIAAHDAAPALGVRDLLAALILLVAIGGEGLADEQMRRFKARTSHGKIMDEGLWRWSRHPNYFFEWFGWLAYPAIAFQPDDPWSWLSLAAPAIMFVILRYGSGVPILERTMLASRGDEFRAYQARVSAFFLLPPKRG